MFKIGHSKTEIHLFKKGAGMMGYGMFFNTVKEIESKIYSRAFLFKNPDSNNLFCFVNVEICFITIAKTTYFVLSM